MASEIVTASLVSPLMILIGLILGFLLLRIQGD
uniref:Cytochrome b6-f complex subunit 7 n=1 Tax=Tolypiocladia glomerulata TaxID=860646 RepID=A0A1Z1MUK5_9FLOR|nr:cytochrome b6-f complex subunit 7 [Tolypiocladia glomerulata]ARW69763.1 cytochrome b6-f complex subunit 7 [Tolypiocladia glomerulata]